MQIVGDLDTDLRSEFTSAGINQTLHRIYLEIKCNVVILTPFETIEQKISNQVLLAEGVIVGEIPNSYYNLEGISKDNAIDIIEWFLCHQGRRILAHLTSNEEKWN